MKTSNCNTNPQDLCLVPYEKDGESLVYKGLVYEESTIDGDVLIIKDRINGTRTITGWENIKEQFKFIRQIKSSGRVILSGPTKTLQLLHDYFRLWETDDYVTD